jgi:hypothetical protein
MTAVVPSAPPNSAERRIAARLQPALGTVCKLLPRADAEHHAIGLVWNISETGVSMLMAEQPARETELAGELLLESGGAGLPIKLRIVHIRAVPTGDYFIGAQFACPIEPGELRRFLAPPMPPASKS